MKIRRQRQMEEERNLKLKQLSDARERQKREIQENKMRRVQLAESCEFFKSEHAYLLVTNFRHDNHFFFKTNSILLTWKRFQWN